MYRRALPSYLHHCHCDWLNHTTWSKRNCWPSPFYTMWYGCWHLVSGRPCYVWFAEPYHVVPLESSAALMHGILVNIGSFFNTIQTPICYVGCLMIANTWIYISLYIRNTAILENKNSVCIFPHHLLNTCDCYLYRLLKCAICRTIPVKMPPVSQFEMFFKVY